MEQLMHYESLNFSEAVNRALLVLIVSMAVPFAGVLLNLLTIPLTFRRLHDTGRSGWWWGIRFVGYFIFVCLFIGDILNILAAPSLELFYDLIFKQILWMIGFAIYHIVFIVVLCLDGDQETNEYGDSEKYFIEITMNEK